MVTRTRILPLIFFVMLPATSAGAQQKGPDRLIVLTFDDSVKSHYTVARRVLIWSDLSSVTLALVLIVSHVAPWSRSAGDRMRGKYDG
jgi:hypothetical protein